MATDIDIEEHDVLADSKVMRIFPDLSLVKSEVLEPDDEPDDTAYQSPSNPEAIPDSTTGYDSPLPYQRTSESPHVVSSTQEDGSKLTPKIIGIQSHGNFFNNCILIGQKTKETLRDVDGSLELDTVPTEPVINDITESTNQGVTNAAGNRIVLGQRPSTVPIAAIETDDGCMDEEELLKCYSAMVLLDDWGPYLEGSDSYCKECEILFATVNALDAHKMIAHSFLVAVESKQLVEEGNATQEPKKVCFVCQKLFVTDDDLIKHIYHHVSTKVECKQCRETFLSKKLLSDHVMMVHAEGEPSGSKALKKPSDVAYKCKKCSRAYPSLLAINTHLRKIHGRVHSTVSDYDVVDRLKSGKIGALNYKELEVKQAAKSQGPSNAKSNSKELLSAPESREFVPKNTLFYCTECDIHFMSLSVAISHKKACPKIESVDCQKCPLTIAAECMASHQFQHELAENASFDVLDVDTKFLKAKLLCVCPKCEEYCSFRSLWSHVSDCSAGVSYHCVPCDIYLHEDSANDHRFAHDAYRLHKDDFITVDYVAFRTEKAEAKKLAADNVMTVGKKRKLEHADSVNTKPPKEASRAIDLEFFYCPLCHFFLPKSGVVKRNSHIAGLCSSQVKRVCFTCGLVMTNNSIVHHHRLHTRPGFTLENFKFFDINTNLETQPPIPEYPQCRKCKCYFLQTKTALKHCCPAMDTITCHECNGKFSQVAYNMHKHFHARRNFAKANNLRTYKPAKKLANKKEGVTPNVEVDTASEMDDKEVSKLRKQIAPKKVCEKASRGVAKFTKKPSPDVSESENEATEAESDSEDMARVIYYCVRCTCCFRTAKGHKDQAGNCYAPETIEKRKRTCKYCGLILTPSLYDIHLKSHEVQGMTLKDYQFKNFAEIPFLTPPVPVYYPCDKCDVTFHTPWDRRYHDCESGSAVVKCEFCGGRFSEAAHRFHVEFHKVGVAESPGEFLVGQCMGCERIFPKSQWSTSKTRHSCVRPKNPYQYKYCDVCNFTVHTEFFAAHTEGHGRSKIVLFDPKVKTELQKDKFVMLHCGACKLIFGIGIENGQSCPRCGLALTAQRTPGKANPPATKLDAGNASGMPNLVAKKLRPSGKRYIFYQCAYCKEAMKRKRHLARHVLYHCGPNVKTFPSIVSCKICGLPINKAKSYHGHMNLHNRVPRIRKDNIDVILCTKSSKKVKFGERKAYVMKSKKVTKTTGSSKEKAPIKKKKNVKSIRKKYTFYHCRNCLSSIRTQPHTCTNVNGRMKRLVKCPLCKLNISLNHYKKHRELHSKLPDLVPDNISLVPIGERKGKVTAITVSIKEANRLLYRGKGKSKATETDDDDSADVPDVATEQREEKVESGDPTSDTEAHLEVEGSPDAKYTYYRCNKCLGCVSSAKKAEEHELFNDCAAWKKNHCDECGLDFVVRFIQGHTLRHNQHPEMTKDNIRIVKFGEASKSPEPSPRRKFVLYQCAECLICYEAQCEHACVNVKRRTCDICQYDFQASHFRKHTECHKNDNYQRSAIKILPLESKPEEDSDMEVTPQRKRRHDGEVTKTVDVFKCSCGLHFLNQKSFNKHELACKGADDERKGLQCSKCDLVLDPTQLVKHSIVHHGNLDCNVKYNVIKSVGEDDRCTVCDTEFRKGGQCPTCDPKSAQKDKATVACPKCRRAVPQSLLLHHLLSHKVQKRQSNDDKAVAVKCFKCHTNHAKGQECQNCDTEKGKSKEETKLTRNQLYYREQVSCPKCGLNMRRSSLHRHLRRHALRENHNKVIGSKMQRSKRVAKGKRLVGQNKAKVKAAGSKDTTKAKQNNVKVHTNAVKKDTNAKAMDSPAKTENTEKSKRMLNCNDCRVHFMSKTAFETHKNKRKHVAPFVPCMVCKLNIYQQEIAAHLKDFHGASPRYSNVLYRCPLCRVHFLKESLLMSHLSRHKMIPPQICPKCDLPFNKSSVKKHIALHHDVMSYEREDFVIKNTSGEVIDIDNDTDRDDDVVFENHETVNGDIESDLETGDLGGRKTKVNKETSDVNVSKAVENEAETETDANLSEKSTEEVLNDDEEEANNEGSKLEEDAKASEKDKDGSFEPMENGLKRCRKGITYYKCVECNVHFMTLQNVQKHLVRHKPLDEFEFIECKLCKLNIKLNSVRTHMEHHKNRSFSLDKVLFVNYVRKNKLVKTPEKPVAESAKAKTVYEINETVTDLGAEKDAELTTHVLDAKEGTLSANSSNFIFSKANNSNPDLNGVKDIIDKEEVPTHILGLHKYADGGLESTPNDLAMDMVADEMVDQVSIESDDILNVSTDSEDPMILGL